MKATTTVDPPTTRTVSSPGDVHITLTFSDHEILKYLRIAQGRSRDDERAIDAFWDEVKVEIRRQIASYQSDREELDDSVEVDEVISPLDGCPNKITNLRKALKPVTDLLDVYRDSGLDEHRPEWGDKPFSKIELIAGRGGKTLLTLEDVENIERALRGIPLPSS